MERHITEDDKQKIINCGAFGYDNSKIANIMSLELSVVEKLMEKGGSFRSLYEIGKDRADYVLDLKLFEMAQGGDLKAMEILDTRKMMRDA